MNDKDEIIEYRIEMLKLYQKVGRYTEALELIECIKKDMESQRKQAVNQFIGRTDPIQLMMIWKEVN